MSNEIRQDDPYALFESWLEEARKKELNDPEAMALATATTEGIPSVRMVLLKEHGKNGFKFHTNADSQKGNELSQNPRASICFHWKSLRRQVRAEGVVKTVSDTDADTYFASRPYNRQIGAWASEQSRPLDSRAHLEARITELEKQYPEGTTVPRPPYWKGYLLVPNKIEFWIGNKDRLHDRWVYHQNDKGGWDTNGLYP